MQFSCRPFQANSSSFFSDPLQFARVWRLSQVPLSNPQQRKARLAKLHPSLFLFLALLSSSHSPHCIVTFFLCIFSCIVLVLSWPSCKIRRILSIAQERYSCTDTSWRVHIGSLLFLPKKHPRQHQQSSPPFENLLLSSKQTEKTTPPPRPPLLSYDPRQLQYSLGL